MNALHALKLGMLMINRLIAIKNLTDLKTDNQQRVFCVLFLQIQSINASYCALFVLFIYNLK